MDNKKKFGQFFTNPIIAEFMTKIAINEDTIDFLDPAAGPGVFVQFANKVNSDLKIDAYEIDHKMILNYNNEIKFKTNLINEDFLYSNTNVYDSIVCNPPYNKFQEIPDRVKLIKLFIFVIRISPAPTESPDTVKFKPPSKIKSTAIPVSLLLA